MRNTIYLFLCSILHQPAYGQTGILYVGIPQAIKVSTEKLKADNEKAATDNGTMVKRGNGLYDITPDKIGAAIIYAVKIGRDGSVRIFDTLRHFKVEEMPIRASFVGKTTGEIDAADVYWSYGPSVYVSAPNGSVNMCTEGWVGMYSFRITVIRNGTEIFKRTYTAASGSRNASVDQQADDFFKTLKNNDKLLLDHLICKDMRGQKHELQPLEFSIKNDEGLKKVDESVYLIDPITGEEFLKKKRH